MLRNCVLKVVNNNVGVERYMYKCSRYKGKCKYASIKVITLLYFVELRIKVFSFSAKTFKFKDAMCK